MSAQRARGGARLRLRGLRAGNLRGVDLDLPLGAWTAVHGPSGAGKSALLFGVLEPVARRRFRVLADPRALPGGAEDWLRGVADEVEGLTPVVAAAGEIPRGRRAVALGAAWGLWSLMDRAWERAGEHLCAACGTHWAPWQPRAVARAFAGAEDGAAVLVLAAAGGARAAELLLAGWTRARLAAGGALARLEEAPEILPISAELLVDRMRWSGGLEDRLAEALALARSLGGAVRVEGGGEPLALPADRLCPACGTARAADAGLPPGPAASARWLHGRPWEAWAEAPLQEWLAWSGGVGGLAARRLELLARCGLGHLAAARTLGSLSLGEARRIELVSWLALVRRGQTVLLDEPGLGLHGRERLAVAAMLQELAAAGNTVLTADPAREFLEAAHGWILLGPEGGPRGGRLVGAGSRRELPQEPLPPARAARAGDAAPRLRFRALRARHLEIAELALPLGRVVAVCGPSGCGKSTLFEEELAPRLRAAKGFEGVAPEGGVGVLLERALRHAPISTVATLAGAWSGLRALFAAGEEAKMRGLAASDFVARPGAGACPACGGAGADAEGLPCAACGALGLREDLLELRWRARPLRDWLTQPIESLAQRWSGGRELPRLLAHLVALGLGPRSLGERGRHLSLGERSRIALARALAAARRGAPRLFLLDEPCLGLPHAEARRVVDLLHALAEQGHSFWVVEHHELFLRQADWLVEIGPGAGAEGGRLLHAGPPADWEGLDTPTAHWWRARARGGAAAPAAPAALPRSRALPGGWAGAGRAELVAALRSELALRSPLEQDAVEEEGEAAEASAPAAWPVAADPSASLSELLGLESLSPELRKRGEARCAACGGAGPWLELSEAARAAGPGTWIFGAPLEPALLARPEHAAWLGAAGFRRFLRDGEVLTARRGAPLALRAGDEAWLDRFDPGLDPEAAGRLCDLEHHARVLGAGEVRAHPPSQPAEVAWTFRSGACRDCGARGVGSRVHFAGWDLAASGERTTADFLSHLERHAPDLAVAARARRLLAGSTLLRRPLGAAAAELSGLERRLARLCGWLLFPVSGAVLLLDQPLAGFPAQLARRLAAALLAPGDGGAFWFTDAEGHAAPPGAARAGGGGCAPQPFALDEDLDSWCEPPRAGSDARLGEALGLEAALREHFARSDSARLRGLGAAELDRGRTAARCPVCRGSGVRSAHPAWRPPCGACRGSGLARAAARVEERGLRLGEAGRRSLAELLAHFAETPALARPLAEAVALGLGAQALDAPLRELPLAARMLAPLAARAAAPAPPARLRLALAAAGLDGLEARAVSSRIAGFTTREGAPEWRDHHPALGDAS